MPFQTELEFALPLIGRARIAAAIAAPLIR
jgi:hypothetical protein